jgi:hypothetical protein
MNQTDNFNSRNMLFLLKLDEENPRYELPIVNMGDEMLENTIRINGAAQGLLKCVYKHPDYFRDLLENLAYGMMLKFEMNRRKETKY